MAKRHRSGHCAKCGVFRNSLHRDHIIPKWNGGLDEEDNVQYLCANCHEDKTWAEHNSEAYKVIARSKSLGRKWTAEQCAAQSARQLGKKRGPNSSRGRALTEEHVEKIRAGWTPEAREAARNRVLGTKR